MTPKRQRLWLFIVASILVCAGVAAILSAFSEQLVYFYTPTQLSDAAPTTSQTLRVGGLVELGSVTTLSPERIRFVITDLTHAISVEYSGVLPNLFREGQGVVAQGSLDAEGVFQARTILAKHDENYMPPEVVDALKASGRWEDYSSGYQKP